MTHSATPCPPSVASAIDTLRRELLTHYSVDFAFHIMGQGHVLSACDIVCGDVRPTPYDAEQQADAREAELERQYPID